MIRQDIETAIRGALEGLGATDVSFVVERPSSMEHGDYATNAALAAAKMLKKNPKEVAELLVSSMGAIEGVEKIEVAGAGFINFHLSHQVIINQVEIAAIQNDWGENSIYKNKRIMVEYTDPNPFKEFHIGHLMSNAIGESVARVLENAGAAVTRANYQGDVGLHVAKAIWAIQNEVKPEISNMGSKSAIHDSTNYYGKAYAKGDLAYRTDENAKSNIENINKEIYGLNLEREYEAFSLGFWYKRGREMSLKHFGEIYEILGTRFNIYFFESKTWPMGLELVKNNIGKVFEESEGAVVYKGEQDGLHTRVFLTKAGLTTYEAKDLGLLKLKEETGTFDRSITVTASEQKEYFKVVLAAAKHIDELKDIAEKTQHITHGMMRFAESKMSSRTGNIITGESLLKDLMEAVKVKMQGRELAHTDKIAEQVAVGAIKYTVLKQGSGRDIIFDLEKSLSVEGDSGLYLQYARVRALSLLNKASACVEIPYRNVELDNDLLEFGSGYRLKRILLHFPDVVSRATIELEPHYITTYLTELASVFNSWYGTERIIIDGTIGEGQIALIRAVEKTLKKGLYILGIPTPEQM